MGLMDVAAVVSRTDRSGRSVALRMLVDTGAVYSVLPDTVWKRLRLDAERVADFTLADGTTISRGVGECRFEIAGRAASSPVVLGGKTDVALLGAVTLETLGLMLNPLSREILPMRLILAGLRGAPPLLPSPAP